LGRPRAATAPPSHVEDQVGEQVPKESGHGLGIALGACEREEYLELLALVLVLLGQPLGVTFEKGDATNLPFKEESFGVSCISFALHEMPGSVRQRVLGELARVTKPGGRIIVVDYALPRNRLASALAYRIVRLYEGDSHASFVRSDLSSRPLRLFDCAIFASMVPFPGSLLITQP
jgi:SAM-dependent methyltransferase